MWLPAVIRAMLGYSAPIEGVIGASALKYAWAEMKAGAREIPPNSNAGEWVEKYTLGRKGPWCAAFVYWCMLQGNGGEPLPFKRTHSAKRLYKRIGRAGSFEDVPDVGDVACWHRGKHKRLGHVGIVSRVHGATFYTIEGNKGRAGLVAQFRHEVGEGNLIGFARI